MPADSRTDFTEYKTIIEGDIQFDDLSQHIKQYQAPMVVTVGEDATHVITRVVYNYETDHCVGFILPTSKTGFLLADSYIAVSFPVAESTFSSNEISKHVYVYMVQPLGKNIPPFCLACIGTNNKFTFETELNRWKYIFEK